ncbi:hypothetical protein D3OALGB2SA_1812 [Olavius algarvensis associated proteobacterium Delta 3]|nr:hypothetical protein D3OALGB2SA_1812 [Olavius algarvensis associated proteobacterium Delta 3]
MSGVGCQAQRLKMKRMKIKKKQQTNRPLNTETRNLKPSLLSLNTDT